VCREQAHMVDCFPPGHQPEDARSDLSLLVSEALDKLSRNTFHPALATQTTLLQSVALKQQQPNLPPLLRPVAPIVAGEAPSVVDMHFDQTKSGRARLNARKRALATRKGGNAAEVRVVGVDAESRGGVGLSEEIRNMLDEEYAEDRERSVDAEVAGVDGARAAGGHAGQAGMDVDSDSEGEIRFPPTQTFGQSSLQARMARGDNGEPRGLFEAGRSSVNEVVLGQEEEPEPEAEPGQPFRSGEVDRQLDGSSSRNGTTVKASSVTPQADVISKGQHDGRAEREDYGVERHEGNGSGNTGFRLGLAPRELGIGIGVRGSDVCARAEWRQADAGRKPSLWAAASGV
jgi:hypothetical protein